MIIYDIEYKIIESFDLIPSGSAKETGCMLPETYDLPYEL